MAEAEEDAVLGEFEGTDTAVETETPETTEAETKGEEQLELPLPTREELEAARRAEADANEKLLALQTNLGEQLKDLRSQMQAQKAKAEEPPPPEPPDFLSDPEAAVNFKLTQKEAQFTKALQDMQGKSDEERNFMLTQLLQTRTAQTEQAFVAAHPDYYDALKHVRLARLSELKMLDVPDENATKAVAQEEMQLAARALQTGKNPAELAYQRAKILGYSPKQTDTETPQTETGADKTREERRAKAAQAQSMGGGGTPDLEETLREGDDEVFAEAFKELTGLPFH